MNMIQKIPFSVFLSSNECCRSSRDMLNNPFGSCTESKSLIPVICLPSMLGFYWEFKCLCYVKIHWPLHLIQQPCSVLTHYLRKQRVVFVDV